MSGKQSLKFDANTVFATVYICWGMWYVFFNASLVLRPMYNVLWPTLVFLGFVLRINKISKYISKYMSTLFYLYILFVIFSIFTLGFSRDQSATIDYLLRFGLAFIYSLVVSSFEKSWLLLEILRIYCIIMLLFSFSQYLFPDFYYSTFLPLVSYGDSVIVLGALHSGESVGLTNGTSQNGLFMCMGFVLFSALFMTSRNSKVLKAVLFILFFGMIFATGKRNYTACAIVLFILSLFFSASNEKRRYRLFRVIFISLVAFFVFLIASKYIPELNNVIDKTVNLNESGDISNGRNLLLADAWKQIRENGILVGIGLDASESVLGGAVHNSYLQWLIEYGILFVVPPILAIIYVPLFRFKKIKDLLLYKNDEGQRYLVLSEFLFLLMVLMSGFAAMPFQWVHIFMLYMIIQMSISKHIYDFYNTDKE